MPNLSTECILGADFMRLFNVVLNPRESEVTADALEYSMPVDVASVSVESGTAGLSEPLPEQLAQLNLLLDEILPTSSDKLGRINTYKHVIDVREAQPIRQRCYPVSKKIEEEMHKQVDELLEEGVIVPSMSEWASPVDMVKKIVYDKQGNATTKYRMCIDFRKINKISKLDAYPVPNLELMLNRLQEARFLSTIDLSKTFHQIHNLVCEIYYIHPFLYTFI